MATFRKFLKNKAKILASFFIILQKAANRRSVSATKERRCLSSRS